MATVQQIYDRVSETLLEPNGLVLELYTEEQFLLDMWQVVGDFMQRTGLMRFLINLRCVAANTSIGYPDYAFDVQEVLYDDRYLRRESGTSLDNLQRNWRNETSSRPERWHEDRLPIKTIQVQPTPTITGGTVMTSADFYGTLSSTAGASTFEFQTTAPFYGTIASYTSPIYVEVPGRLLGTISALVSSSMNTTLLSTLRPMVNSFELADTIDFLPESFVGYLTYGVLAKVFARDGETRDAAREKYCTARFDEGIMLATAISDESEQEEP